MALVLQVKALSVCAQGRTILDSVDLTINRGECVALVGESGSGKSMTALSIMRLLPPGIAVAKGDVRLEEVSLFAYSEAQMCQVRGGRIAMIFQEPMNALNPVMCVGDQIAEALRLHQGVSRPEAKRRCEALFEEVALPQGKEWYARYPHELSGGQKQRAMIAMALACEPKLLIADEPTTALDVTVQAEILGLLKRIVQTRKLAMLFISHDLGVVAQVADRIGVMQSGRLIETASAADIFETPKHPYTQKLIASFKETTRPAPSNEASESPLLSCKEVSVRFRTGGGWLKPKRHAQVLDAVSLRIKRGETLALVGESGSGKSTLAKAIVGLVPLSGGRIEWEGERIDTLAPKTRRAYRRSIQMIFQDPFSSLNPRMRIGDIIAEGIEATGMDVGDVKAYVAQVLDDVGLERDAIERYPHAFSGGQRQRIAIARALALEPKLIVCDEPTSALDVTTRGVILDLLRELQTKRGVSYLFITHDLALVPRIAHRVAVMQAGRIVEVGDTRQVMRSPKHPYTRRLLQSVPTIPYETKRQ